jgi:hypothetical protein
LNSYHKNVSRPDYIAGSGNHTECFQNIATMGRQMLLVKKAMEIGKELGIRQCLHENKAQTLIQLKVSTQQTNENYTKKSVCGNDGRRGYILVPKKRMLAKNKW